MNNKHIGILLSTILLSCVLCTAQNNSIKNTDTLTAAPKVESYNNMNYVIQSSGKTFNHKDMQNMATKDILQIANTVNGVQYRVGEPIIIRGTSIGTAYFVDGVRVYGSLPILMK